MCRLRSYIAEALHWYVHTYTRITRSLARKYTRVNILPNITSDRNVNDDVDASTSLPVNPDSVTLHRSVRPKKPIERSVAGSK